MRTFLLAWTVLLGLFLAPAEARLLTADLVREPQSLLPYCSWLADPEGAQTVESVSSGSLQERFSPLGENSLFKSSGPVWIRLVMIKMSPTATGSVRLNNKSRLVMNLGRLPAGGARVFFSQPPGPVEAEGVWHAEDVASHEDLLLPEPGILPVSVYIRLPEMPGLWFAPTVSPQDMVKPALVPSDLVLPGLFIAAAVACLLRAAAERAMWALWAALFAVCCLGQAVVPLPGGGRGLGFDALPPLLAPGLALILLPHVGRCFFRTHKGHPVQDIWLYLVSLAGVALALLPLIPGFGWLPRLFPLWPLALILLFPVCARALAAGKPGSLAYGGVCVLPALGAGLTLYTLFDPSLLHTLTAQAGLWGLALGCLGLSLAKGVSAPAAQSEAGQNAGPEPDLAGHSGDAGALPLEMTGTPGAAGTLSLGAQPLSSFNLQAFSPDGAGGEDGGETATARAGDEAPASARPEDAAPAFAPPEGEAPASVRPVPEQDRADEAETLSFGPDPVRGADLDDNADVRWTVIKKFADECEGPAAGLPGPDGGARPQAAVEDPGFAAPEPGANAPARPADEAATTARQTPKPEPGPEPDRDESLSAADSAEAWQPVAADPAEKSAAESASAPSAAAPMEGAVGREQAGAAFQGRLLPDFAAVATDDARPAEDAARIISLIDEDLSAYAPNLPDMGGPDEDAAALPSSLTDDGLFLFSLHSLVRDVHDIVEPLAKAKGLIFSWYIAPTLPSLLEGDAPRLRGALSLLLQNAVQVTRRGAVQLAVRKIPGSDQAGDLLFTITDNGSAQRTDAGFFHAWELAARSGGSFSVDYSPQNGTQISFTVRFALPSDQAARNHLARHPFAAELYPELVEEVAGAPDEDPIPVLHSQSPVIAPEGEDEPLLAAMRPEQVLAEQGRQEAAAEEAGASGAPGALPALLVGEMTTSNRRLIAGYLTDVPHEHVNAESNAQVLEYYQQNPVALTIFDADMPEPDIIKSIARLREEDARRGLATPVLVLTSHTAQSVRMLEAGASYALCKPYKRQALRDMVALAVPSLASHVLKREGAPAPKSSEAKKTVATSAASAAPVQVRAAGISGESASTPPPQSGTDARAVPPVAAPAAGPALSLPPSPAEERERAADILEEALRDAPRPWGEHGAPPPAASLQDSPALAPSVASLPPSPAEDRERAADILEEALRDAPRPWGKAEAPAPEATPETAPTPDSTPDMAPEKPSAPLSAPDEAASLPPAPEIVLETPATAPETAPETAERAFAAATAALEKARATVRAASEALPQSARPAPDEEKDARPVPPVAAARPLPVAEREVDLLAEALRGAPLPGDEVREVTLPPRHSQDGSESLIVALSGGQPDAPAAQAAPMLLGLSPEDVTPAAPAPVRETPGGGLLDFVVAEPEEDRQAWLLPELALSGREEAKPAAVEAGSAAAPLAAEAEPVAAAPAEAPEAAPLTPPVPESPQETPVAAPEAAEPVAAAPVEAPEAPEADAEEASPIKVTVSPAKKRVPPSVRASVSVRALSAREAREKPGPEDPAPAVERKSSPDKAAEAPQTAAAPLARPAAPVVTVGHKKETPESAPAAPGAPLAERKREPGPPRVTVSAKKPSIQAATGSAKVRASAPDAAGAATPKTPAASPAERVSAPEAAPAGAFVPVAPKTPAPETLVKSAPAPAAPTPVASVPAASVPVAPVPVAPEAAGHTTSESAAVPAPAAPESIPFEAPAPEAAPETLVEAAPAGASVPLAPEMSAEASAPSAPEMPVPDAFVEAAPAQASAPAAPEAAPAQGFFELPGMEGEKLDPVILPLLPGVMLSLRQALADMQSGLAGGSSILVQEASARLAGKAEHFGLYKLGKIARCVERAAEAGDLDAVSTLMEDLVPVTGRYVTALDDCFTAFLNADR